MSEALEIWGVSDPNISAQLALAFELDLFKGEVGLDVSCKFIESGTMMADDVLNATKKPFAFTQTPITALLLHEKGLSTKLVAPLADISATQQVIVHKSSGISQPKDLEGKQIGMARGAAIYLPLKHMAKDCNVDLNKVRFVDLLPHDQLEAFKTGKVDVIASWEPWTLEAQRMGGYFYFSGTRSEIPGIEGDINWLINQSCLIVPETHLEKQSEPIVAILNVLQKATDLINRDREKATDVLASFFGISQKDLFSAMQKNHYSLAMTNLFRLGILGFRDFLYDTGQISSKFPERLLHDTTFLRQLDPALVLLEDIASQNVTIIEENGIYYREDFTCETVELPLKILLVDDSRYVRASLTKAISQIDGEVIGEATTGIEAIDMFTLLRPNVVTMDLTMPDMSGIRAVKIILQIDPNVIIIVISGTDHQEVREEVFNLGVKMFITKPFDPEQVAAILKNTLSVS